MKKLLYKVMVVASLYTVFGLVMKTSVIKSIKNFEWIVENLNELPEEIKSLPFTRIENDIFKGVIVLAINTLDNKLKIGVEGTGFQNDQSSVNGLITFRNATDHYIGESYVETKSIDNYMEAELLQVDILDLFGTPSLREVFEMLNNTLILDFDLTFTTTVTEYANSDKWSSFWKK